MHARDLAKSLTILMSVLCLLLVPSLADASDYKDWIPLLPDSIGGLSKSGDPDGANMEMSGQSWSTLQQRYAQDNGNDIELTIVAGAMAPQVRQFQSMRNFDLETDEKIAQTLKIAGRPAFFELYKGGGKGTLGIALQENAVMAIEADAVESKDGLISLADDVPLEDIAAQID